MTQVPKTSVWGDQRLFHVANMVRLKVRPDMSL